MTCSTCIVFTGKLCVRTGEPRAATDPACSAHYPVKIQGRAIQAFAAQHGVELRGR